MSDLAALVARATEAFQRVYGTAPTDIVQAPGRVNLIGEHTDYNDGFVLPCAINCWTVVAAGPSGDSILSAVAADHGDAHDAVDLAQPILPHGNGHWADHVRGVASELLVDGASLSGMNIAIAGNVPQGAGLSSSASLAVALGLAFTRSNGQSGYGPTALAKIAQRSENDFVGCKCGIMDQMASAHGKAGAAMLLDCRSLAITPVTIPAGLTILVIHSGISRGLVDSHYNKRREQCEAAARHFGVPALRDVSSEQLAAAQSLLDNKTFRRARHVVTETDRTTRAAAALAARDMKQLGALMVASHASMRDDFEITLPPIDMLVDLINGIIDGRGGARMTGGGFGGCVVALVPDALSEAVIDGVNQGYQTPVGGPPQIFRFDPSPGAGVIAQPVH